MSSFDYPTEIASKEHDGSANVFLKKVGTYGWDSSALEWVRIKVNSDGELLANLESSDIQIGAVELKNATSDDRASISAAGALKVDGTVTASVPSGIEHGVKTVTTAGTDVALATTTTCKKVDIQAQTDNTGIIAVGGSGVDATEATGTGIILYPGDTYSLEINDLASVFIDSSVDGEGVRFCFFT